MANTGYDPKFDRRIEQERARQARAVDDALAQTFKERDAAWENNAALRQTIHEQAEEIAQEKALREKAIDRLDEVLTEREQAVKEKDESINFFSGQHAAAMETVGKLADRIEQQAEEIARLNLRLADLMGDRR